MWLVVTDRGRGTEAGQRLTLCLGRREAPVYVEGNAEELSRRQVLVAVG